jgi:nicotinate phosphoribosyltransferase
MRVSVAKRSADKASIGGRKAPVRVFSDGVATTELVRVGEHETAAHERALLVPLVRGGVVDERYTGHAGVERARAHRRAAMAELPADAFRLGRGEPVIPTVYA